MMNESSITSISSVDIIFSMFSKGYSIRKKLKIHTFIASAVCGSGAGTLVFDAVIVFNKITTLFYDTHSPL